MDLKITPSGQTIVKPTALGPVANTDTKLLIYGLFQKGRVLAQDDVVKPFSPTELVARIQAALRGRDTPPEPYRLGDLAIHYEERQVTVAGRPVQLTVTEYDLLRALSVNAGRVLTHEFLLRRVWGPQNSGDARLVRAFVKKLRRKLGDVATSPAYIVTEPRVGYRMAKAVSSEPSGC